MKKLLIFLNKLYKNERKEKQYLVIETVLNEYKEFLISDDVSEDAANSSYQKFKTAGEYYKKVNGLRTYVVHNHPKSTPEPSYMDFRNANLISSWSSICKMPVNDYIIFSKIGYYSFLESGDWNLPPSREAKDLKILELGKEIKNYNDLLEKQKIINQVLEESNEIFVINDKIFYSFCLPLEFIKKEVENVDVNLIYFFKQQPKGEKNTKLIKRFLHPTVIVEVHSDGRWKTFI